MRILLNNGKLTSQPGFTESPVLANLAPNLVWNNDIGWVPQLRSMGGHNGLVDDRLKKRPACWY